MAAVTMPITVLEGMLSQKGINFDDSYLIEVAEGDFATIGELKEFWIEEHKRLEETKKIIAEAKELINGESKSEDEKGLQKVKGMEESQNKEKKRPRRNRPDNKK